MYYYCVIQQVFTQQILYFKAYLVTYQIPDDRNLESWLLHSYKSGNFKKDFPIYFD